jgi:hypothetical protein
MCLPRRGRSSSRTRSDADPEGGVRACGLPRPSLR